MIEVCIYVEDFWNDFFLLIGILLILIFFYEISWIDSGVIESDIVFFYYDFMILKLMVYSLMCEEVVLLFVCVLGMMCIVGVEINI